jgi:CRISPR-associated Csx3 family protein
VFRRYGRPACTAQAGRRPGRRRRVERPYPFHYLKFRLDGRLLLPSDLPDVALPPPLDAHRHLGLMLSGRGPLWLYGHLVHLAHPFAWVAVYDPRLSGGVVVQRHRTDAPQLGEVVPFLDEAETPTEAAAPAPAERRPAAFSWSPWPGPEAGVLTLELGPVRAAWCCTRRTWRR